MTKRVVTAGFGRCLFFFFDSKHFFGTKAAASRLLQGSCCSRAGLAVYTGIQCSPRWDFQVSHQRHERIQPFFTQPKTLGSQIVFHHISSKYWHEKSHWNTQRSTKVEIFLPYISSWLLSDFCCWGIQLYNCDCVVRWLQHPIASNFGIERWKMERCFPWRLKRILKKSQDEFWSSYIHSLKLTANALENKQFPKRKRESIPSLYFQVQAATLVSGRIHIHIKLLITWGLVC